MHTRGLNTTTVNSGGGGDNVNLLMMLEFRNSKPMHSEIFKATTQWRQSTLDKLDSELEI